MNKFEIIGIILSVCFVVLVVWLGIAGIQRNNKCEELGGVMIDQKCISNLNQIKL